MWNQADSYHFCVHGQKKTNQLQAALDYSKSRGYSILLTADTKSHSKIWENETNTRGKKWEELIEIEHLLVHNQGRIPTFESKIGKSIIDVTLSHRLPYTIENWRVLRSYNGTDHNTIHYSLKDSGEEEDVFVDASASPELGQGLRRSTRKRKSTGETST